MKSKARRKAGLFTAQVQTASQSPHKPQNRLLFRRVQRGVKTRLRLMRPPAFRHSR